MDDAFVGLIVGVGKQNFPVGWKDVCIYSKTVILGCHIAPRGTMMDAGLVVAAVAVPTIRTVKWVLVVVQTYFIL